MKFQTLVVDDNEDARDILSMFLQSRGFVTAEAVNGLDALEKTGLFMPDIILTDIAMPVMDGWGFLSRKWEDAKIAKIPVIVISASVEMRTQRYPYEVMPKPVDLQKLVEKVRLMLQAA